MRFLLIFLFFVSFPACENPLGDKNVVDEGFQNNTPPTSGNTAPTISTFSTESHFANKTSSLISVTINDSEQLLTCGSSLSMVSSDTSLVSNSSVAWGGIAPNCTAVITPNIDQVGNATLAFIVTDGSLEAQALLNYRVKFSPDVLSSLQLWLDASDESSLFQDVGCSVTPAASASDPVGCWKDISGNNFDASIGAGGNQPSLNLVANAGAVSFDGIDDYYDNAHSYTARVVYIVYRVDSVLQLGTDLGQVWGQYTQAHIATDGRSLGTWSLDGNTGASGRYNLNGDNLSPSITGDASQPWVYDQFDIVGVEYDADQSITRQIMGNLFPTFPVGTHQFGGQISEVVVFSDSLPSGEKQKVEGYLACKWSLQSRLPVPHPYSAGCP